MGYDEQHPPAHTPGAISERGPATPWNQDDYEFPPSVGPVSHIFFKSTKGPRTNYIKKWSQSKLK